MCFFVWFSKKNSYLLADPESRRKYDRGDVQEFDDEDFEFHDPFEIFQQMFASFNRMFFFFYLLRILWHIYFLLNSSFIIIIFLLENIENK